jgi:uncharacterized protein YaaN involved in tellurite resistance
MSEEQNRSQQFTEEGAGNVDKIRDILFGHHMRDYESRFKRLEENLVRESAEIREMTRQRLDALEEYIKKEFESQTHRLRSEREERTANVQQQERDLRELSQNLSRRLTEANDLAAETSRSIREEILSRSTNLLNELQAKHQEAGAALDRHVADLKDAKADRATIAELLSEMAMRLKGDFKLPAPGESDNRNG